MYDDIVKTKILIQHWGIWRGLKHQPAYSVASTNVLSRKMATEAGFTTFKIFPSGKNQKLPLQFGSGGRRFYSRRYNQVFAVETTW